MRASASELRTEAEAKARATALRCTREAVCPECGQLARLRIVSDDYGEQKGGYLVTIEVVAVASWQCCNWVGPSFSEAIRA